MKKNWPKVILLLIGLLSLIVFLSYSFFEKEDSKQWVSRDFKFVYAVTIPEIPRNTKNITIHIPLLQSDKYQTISSLKITSPFAYSIYYDPDYKSKILYLNINDHWFSGSV